MHAALAILLARLGSTDDVVIGTPIAGRGDRALDDLIGMFVGTLALRTKVEPAQSFRALAEHCRQVDLGAFANADVPFERVVDTIGPNRSTAYAPIASVSLEFQNNDRPVLTLPELDVRGIDPELDVVKVDLEFLLAEEFDDDGAPTGMSGAVDFATDLFDRRPSPGLPICSCAFSNRSPRTRTGRSATFRCWERWIAARWCRRSASRQCGRSCGPSC